MLIDKKSKNKLYTQIRHLLGMPIVGVELKEEQMDSLFEISIEEVSEYINDWLTSQNWATFYGMNKESGDLLFALTQPTLELERKFSFAYSKQVGLGQDNPNEWGLKFDYVEIDPNEEEQIFDIPNDREINEVLWKTNSNDVDRGTFGRFDGFQTLGALPNGGFSYYGQPMSYMLPLYAIMAAGQHNNMFNRLLRSELTYRIFPGYNDAGEPVRKLQLFPIPNGSNDTGRFNFKGHPRTKVFYWYYDKSIIRDKCSDLEKKLIRNPADIELDSLEWGDLSDAFKSKVRRLFIAKCKRTVAYMRGKFSGELNFDDAVKNLDYRMFLDDAQREEESFREEMKEFLALYDYLKILEDRANAAENLNRNLQYVPFKAPITVI